MQGLVEVREHAPEELISEQASMASGTDLRPVQEGMEVFSRQTMACESLSRAVFYLLNPQRQE